jgi:hypothetical protein
VATGVRRFTKKEGFYMVLGMRETKTASPVLRIQMRADINWALTRDGLIALLKRGALVSLLCEVLHLWKL